MSTGRVRRRSFASFRARRRDFLFDSRLSFRAVPEGREARRDCASRRGGAGDWREDPRRILDAPAHELTVVPEFTYFARVLRVRVRACDACLGAENAAATSPAVAKGRLAASAPRSAIGGLRSGSRPSPCNPSRNAGSAGGGGISRPAHSVSAELWWRSGGAPPATARASGVRRAIHPRLRREALGRNTSRRAAQPHSRRLPRPAVCACSASCRRLPAMLRAGKR